MFGVATLIAFAAVLAFRRSILLGAAVGLAAAAAGWLLADPLVRVAATLDAPGLSQLAANWPFVVAGGFAAAALGTSWDARPLGAIFGALLFAFFVTPFATVALAPYWLFALGGLFVAVTLLLPLGIVGTLRQWIAGFRRWWSERRARALASAAVPRPAE
jgi:hypothetical protein